MHAPVRKLPPVVAGAALAAVVLAAPALAGNAGFQPVTPQSPNAKHITSAMYIVIRPSSSADIAIDSGTPRRFSALTTTNPPEIPTLGTA